MGNIEAGQRMGDSLLDRFSDTRAAGDVIGSAIDGRNVRKGVDRERVLSIDNQALRIAPLLKAGWGRAGISYGPFPRRHGLAFGVFLLNGHNISRTSTFPDGFRMRLWRWRIGNETEQFSKRVRPFLRSRQKAFTWRRMLHWFRNGSRFFQIPVMEENLSLGWFPGEAPAEPVSQGSSLSVHAVVPEGGEIWARAGGASLRAFQGLQNIPIYYFVVLREQGAAYYATALVPGVRGMDSFPFMRLLAIDPFETTKEVYAGIHQSVLGEIGFRADTRIYRTQIASVPNLSTWYGTAHGADRLIGEGPLHGSPAEIGGIWNVPEGQIVRTDRGAAGQAQANSAILNLSCPAGLIHCLFEIGLDFRELSIFWRYDNADNYWSLELNATHCCLVMQQDGLLHRFPAVEHAPLGVNTVNSLQITDDGEQIQLHLNGEQLYGSAFRDTRMNSAASVGFKGSSPGESLFVLFFEAHPRQIPVPTEFQCEPPLTPEYGSRIVIEDRFSGPRSELAGHKTELGDKIWKKEIGAGVFELTGDGGVKVQATAQAPCPNRTAYTVEWNDNSFADLQVIASPPGTQKGQNERGRGGLIFWQDPRTYIVLNLWNDDACWSLSSFFRVDGFEEIYDAVWTNIGRRVRWGISYQLRVIFQRNGFWAHLNGEPVLYRALTDIYPDWTDFKVNRVGIVANWEWGTDTGSTFHSFVGRDRK